MQKKNALTTGGQSAFHVAGHYEKHSTSNRPTLQANQAMQSRLIWLARIASFPMLEARNG